MWNYNLLSGCFKKQISWHLHRYNSQRPENSNDEVAKADSKDIVKCSRHLISITTALCKESVPAISPLKDQLCNIFLQPKEDSLCEKNVKQEANWPLRSPEKHITHTQTC